MMNVEGIQIPFSKEGGEGKKTQKNRARKSRFGIRKKITC